MEKKQYILLICTLYIFAIISIITIIIAIMYTIKGIKYSEKYANAINYMGTNKIYCQVQLCPVQNDSYIIVPDFPLDIFSKSGNVSQKEIVISSLFMNFLVARVAKSYIEKRDYIVPPNIKDKMTILSKYSFNGNLIGVLCKLQTFNGPILTLCFRGTVGIDEWIKDFTFQQTEKNNLKKNSQSFIYLKPFQYGNLNNLDNLNDLKNSPIMVHSGFNCIYSQFKDELMKDMTKYKEISNIAISGHSLGCALGTLAALDIATWTSPKNVFITLSASPLVGNKSFVDTITNINNIKIIVYTNTCDIVPTLPLSVTPNFTEPESPYFYSTIPINNTVYFTSNRLSLSNNHWISTYIDFLIDRLKNVV